MRVRLCLLTAALALVPVVCSVVDGGKVQRVDAPRELTDTLPTTTTTAVTTTTLAVSTTTGLETTTTEVRVEGVRLYFIASGKLSPVIGSLPSGYALSQLIALLQKGPPEGEVGVGLRSAIPSTVEITALPDGTGVAQVLLPEGFFDTIPAGDQRLAVAQIVMTLLDNTPGVGQVAFNLQVSGPAGEFIPAGQLLTRADYQTLLASTVTPATTSPLAQQEAVPSTLAA